jgi:hypothetical protein
MVIFMSDKDLIKKIAVIILPFAAVFAAFCVAYIYRNYIMPHVTGCLFHTLTGYYCTGCGNTRAVFSLLKGKAFESIRHNPAIVFLSFTVLGYYIELLLKTFGKPKKIVPRGKVFWLTVLGTFLLYYFIRNLFPILSPDF